MNLISISRLFMKKKEYIQPFAYWKSYVTQDHSKWIYYTWISCIKQQRRSLTASNLFNYNNSQYWINNKIKFNLITVFTDQPHQITRLYLNLLSILHFIIRTPQGHVLWKIIRSLDQKYSSNRWFSIIFHTILILLDTWICIDLMMLLCYQARTDRIRLNHNGRY